ncbi:unnamed protein product, partial [Echinostoma caproni]|uniref:Protein kinase domain-containing protein n=1 Tax=Echinostoma caproni TaxID=27848 RepID=A0A183AQL0_9TREM
PDPSQWDGGTAADPIVNPGFSEYLPHEFGSDLCISYAQRQKPPKVLAKRFLLGQTIGRGSYGKVKDAIDLITMKRHAVKVISKLGVRKIPGGWSQALLEATVMRRLPAHRHIVSLVTALRVDNPDRLCLVMEHCLGSVHDLQSIGVPSLPNEFDEDSDEQAILERSDESPDPQQPLGISPPLTNQKSPSRSTKSSATRTHRTGKHRFRLKCPIIETDLKQEPTRYTEAFMNRKVSNVEGSSRRKSSVLHSVHHQQQQQQQFRRLPEAQAHAYFLQHPATASCKPETNARALFRELKDASFVTKLRAWLLPPPATEHSGPPAKAVLRHLCPSNFPPICNSSGTVACDPHERAEVFSSRFASNSTLSAAPTVQPSS